MDVRLVDGGADWQMDLTFQAARADAYKSASQKIRNLSENWVSREAYCPNCGQPNMGEYHNNRPVADFFCSCCNEDYELKSQAKIFGPRVVDGAYRTMIERLKGLNNPNLFLLHYDAVGLSVLDLLVIPKYLPRQKNLWVTPGSGSLPSAWYSAISVTWKVRKP